MTHMMSTKAFNAMNMEDISKNFKGESIHIMPDIKKVSVINLGMAKDQLMNIVNMNFSVTVYDEDFSANELKDMDCDAVLVTGGNMDPVKVGSIADKLKTVAGKKKLFGIGSGKDIVQAAVQEDAWKQQGKIYIGQKAQTYGCDTCEAESLSELFKFI